MEERDLTEALGELTEFFRPRRAVGLRGLGFEGGHVTWDEAQIERAHLALRQHAHRSALLRHELARATFLRCGLEARRVLALGFETWSDGADLQTTALRLAMMHGSTLCLQSLAVRTRAAAEAYCRAHPGKEASPGAVHAWFLSMMQAGAPRQRGETLNAHTVRKLEARRAAERRLSAFRQVAWRALLRAVAEYDVHRRARVQAHRMASAAHEAEIARRLGVSR